MVLSQLLENNRLWTAELFDNSARMQAHRSPTYYWLGCCDGPFGIAPRLGLEPGDLFVHRNLANIVCDTDTSGLAALQYAVDVLEVCHIIICGHTACRGLLAATDYEPLGLSDCWVSEVLTRSRAARPIRDSGPAEKNLTRLCRQNVREQVSRLSHLRLVRDAWRRGQALSVHGWMHDDATGLFTEVPFSNCDGHSAARRRADVAASEVTE